MKKTILFLLTTTALLANKPTTDALDEAKAKIHNLVNSPFLINKSGLPHLTKMLMQSWDDEKLKLSDKQKEKLLIVKKDTLKAVKTLKKKLQPLEEDIMQTLVDVEDVKTLDTKVDEVAKLKAEATKVHLKCIHDTLSILNEKQITYLLPFWDM